MKKDRIFNELRQGILRGTFAVGEKLPTELELAAHYQVARGTVRNSLKRLEEEGFLERVKSKGTFIRQPVPKSCAEKVISFLIPYPGYIRQTHDPVFAVFSQAFYGAIRAAAEDGWRVETVPFSRTNDNYDIDWETLEHIGQNSRLIIFNHWYHPAFHTFLKRGTRVGIIRFFNHVKSPWDDCFNSWIDAVVDSRKMAFDAVNLLHSRGCRRILNANTHYEDVYNGKTAGYRDAVDRLGLPRLEFNYDQFFGAPDYSGNVCRRIRSLWEETRFDALFAAELDAVCSNAADLYAALELPHSVKIILSRDDSRFLNMNPQISAFHVDTDRIGYTLAKLLTKDHYTPCRLMFEHQLEERESSGGAHVPVPKPQIKNNVWSIV